MNLLNETVQTIVRSGHTPEDIIFIGSKNSGHSCSWDEFLKLADVDYDAGYGAQHVASDLIIAFKDASTMWRHEHDGSEWWAYSKPFEMPKETKPIKRLVVSDSGWMTLEEINDETVSTL